MTVATLSPSLQLCSESKLHLYSCTLASALIFGESLFCFSFDYLTLVHPCTTYQTPSTIFCNLTHVEDSHAEWVNLGLMHCISFICGVVLWLFQTTQTLQTYHRTDWPTCNRSPIVFRISRPLEARLLQCHADLDFCVDTWQNLTWQITVNIKMRHMYQQSFRIF